MGADCYSEHKKAWCRVGDWVLTGKYIGHKFRYGTDEYCIINDDEVIAVVPDEAKVSAK
jgi:co-chaperonin GroES (HSP10)